MTAAAQLLNAIVPIVCTRLPAGVDVAYLDDFVGRNRFALEAVIEQNLGPLRRRMEVANNGRFRVEDIPEFRTAAKRTAANIAAMATAANLYTRQRTPKAGERAGGTEWPGAAEPWAARRRPGRASSAGTSRSS